jgi:hypothetical protein
VMHLVKEGLLAVLVAAWTVGLSCNSCREWSTS